MTPLPEHGALPEANSQDRANQMLSRWQEKRGASLQERLGDIGGLTFGLRTGALDLFEVWMQRPYRRIEFGSPEREDICIALKALGDLLLEMDGVRAIESDYAA